jgi:hypothetical protein
MAELWVDRGIGHRGARSLMSPRWFRVFPAACWLGFRFGGGVQRPILAVALPVEGIGGATALPLLACRAGDRVSAEACQHSQRPNGSAHPPPARRWCCCHTLKSSPPTPDPEPPHRKGHRHEPKRVPAAISDPPDSRQRTAHLRQRSQSLSPSGAPSAPLPQATLPRPSSPAEPHRLGLTSRCPWQQSKSQQIMGLASPTRRKTPATSPDTHQGLQ